MFPFSVYLFAFEPSNITDRIFPTRGILLSSTTKSLSIFPNFTSLHRAALSFFSFDVTSSGRQNYPTSFTLTTSMLFFFLKIPSRHNFLLLPKQTKEGRKEKHTKYYY
ncbi:hypothetical protein, unlikely [Trypanosoma brucei brucei TREU927]|uniref:Uncharacterized protein n=1 Tax=Trypanosoma brucei brucei (strain 927/4 GUTat10.1) TaxID=185431 RepID=Q38EF5_TRYB2|nr:hypothetical protein, unlikely [Trypanosoma brucei brucei TREU927]EAN76815.1 hypothetical protein, unlikely [Trypanosoma brucei brucei TREU927]